MTQLAKTPKNKVNELKEFVKNTNRKDEYRRGTALIKLTQGMKRSEVADFFDIDIKTLDQWQRNFKQSGIDGLKTKPQIGNNKKLSKQDKEAIKKIINENNPKELKLDPRNKFWTIELLKKYVKQKHGVAYENSESYRRLFKFCEFSYHKPDKVNKKQSPHMRKRFQETLKKSSNGIEEKIAWSW